MRQDPDVIMVGEIRDVETAEMAVRSAMTGHIVLSTVHANDAPSTATRLVDDGRRAVPSRVGALARGGAAAGAADLHALPLRDEAEEKALLGLGIATSRVQPEHYFDAKGCAECSGRKYLGRVAIFELLEIDSARCRN